MVETTFVSRRGAVRGEAMIGTNVLARGAGAVALAAVLAGCATSYEFTPIAEAGQTVRYENGMATATAEGDQGSVRTSPLGFNDEKQVMFGVAVYNGTDHPLNMSYDKIRLWTGDGKQIALYDKSTLERQVRNRAMIAAVATAAAGAAAAYSAQQNAYSHSYGSVTTPRGGLYTFRASTYDAGAAAAGVAVASAATGAGLVAIHNKLGETLSGLNGRVLQTSTVDPGQSYGGVVVGDRLKGSYPQELVLRVSWAGGEQAFRYRVSQSTK